MKKRIRNAILSIFTSLLVITGCQPINELSPKSPLLGREGTFTGSSQSSATIVTGKVEFPNNLPLLLPSLGKRGAGGEFSTKALLSEVAPSATVSILYPSDHPTRPNVTIATGLTDGVGNFIINPSTSFNPAVNSVYVLEASKRIGGNGNDNMAIRTYIKWNGSGWDSMTTPGIYINTKTTALAVIQENMKTKVSALNTIGKIIVSEGTSNPQNIGDAPVLIEAQTVTNVAGLVTHVLSNNYDPMNYIKLVNGEYIIVNPPIINIPNVIYVDEGATGINNGTSWANAYTSLQSALSAATSGKDIWIATGTYKPGTLVTDTFQLKDGVRVYGGFAGSETQLNQRNYNIHLVILSGDLNNSNFADSGDCYHVVKGATGAVLDGVTVKFGYAKGTPPDNHAGGMLNINSSPTLANVAFSNHSATGGGAMYNYSSSPVLTNVTFSNNSATNNGGGMYNINSSSPVLTNVTFSGNSAPYGGGMYNGNNSSPVLTNVTFSNNSATYSGGGMYNYSSSPTLTNVTFSSNSATQNGGGMSNNSSFPILTNVTFSSNSATFNPSWGGGMSNNSSSPILTNVTFSSNLATQEGGGMSNSYSSSPVLTNVNFSGNSAPYGGGMSNYSSSPTLKNTIFWENTATNSISIYNFDTASTVKIGYSDVEGGFSGIAGGTIKDITGTTTLDATTFNTVGFNISSDPLFLNASDLDGVDNIMMTSDDGLSLQSGSPARNTGTATGAPATDIAGVTRPRGAGVDMGAYEFVE